MPNEEEEQINLADKKKTIRIPWKGLGILLVLLAIISLGCWLYIGNMRLIAVHDQQLQFEGTIQNNIQRLETALTEVQQNADVALRTSETTSNKLAQIQPISQDQWKIAEARYFIKLADNKLQFENNVAESITLLKLADQIFQEISDLKYDEVRKALAIDITNLQSVAVVDVTGLYMRLSALNEKIEQLPLMNKPTTGAAIAAKEPDANSSLPWWQRGLETTWQSLRQIVVVRYHQNGKLPLISPDQQVYFYQNLHAVILQSIWALLHGQSAIYQTSLQQANSWIKEYGVTDSPITQAILNDLSQLEKINIHPVVPKITSLQVLG